MYNLINTSGHHLSFPVVEPGQKAWKKIQKVFGPDVFTESGELNRAALAEVIFDDAEKRMILNDITHPQIHKRMYKEVLTYFSQGYNFIVMELPLLFETGVMGDYLHKIITVTWWVEERWSSRPINGRGH